jgi:hypothetical protein
LADTLSPHQANGFRAWTNKLKAASFDLFSEIRVLRQKSVTGVNAIGARYFRPR